MRLKVTIGYTIVVMALFVIALIFENDPTATNQIKDTWKAETVQTYDQTAQNNLQFYQTNMQKTYSISLLAYTEENQ